MLFRISGFTVVTWLEDSKDGIAGCFRIIPWFKTTGAVQYGIIGPVHRIVSLEFYAAEIAEKRIRKLSWYIRLVMRFRLWLFGDGFPK